MTDTNKDIDFYVPSIVKSKFERLLLPGEKLEEIFDQIGGLILEGSSEIKPDDTVWGSKTMTLNKKKPRTLDTFFSKVKTETSDAESNCSLSSNNETVAGSSSKMNEPKKSPDSIARISENESNKTLTNKKNTVDSPSKKLKSKINKSKSNQHSVSSSEDESESSEKNVRNSPTYSVDLFGEEIQKSSDQSHKPNSKHSSDEEIIPFSQVHQSSGQNSLMKSKTQDVSLEREISSSSDDDEDSEQPVLSKLDSIKNSMKNVKEIFCEIESNSEKFSFEDLTEDDEIYTLQCPSEIDSKKLEGVELTLKGNSVVSIEEDVKYDSLSLKESSKRYLYVALPDSNKQGMRLGVFQLAGHVILSENLDVPFTKSIDEDDTLRDFTINSSSSLNESSPSQLCPTKKKKHSNTDDSLNDETAVTKCFSQNVSNVLNQLVSKKKKRKHTSLESSDIDSKISESKNIKSEYEDIQINHDPQDEETPMISKKKKKRSNEGKGLNSSFSDSNKIQTENSDWRDSEIIPDTKDQDKDLNSSFLDSKKAVHLLKSDWKDSQIIPDTQDQETPMKSKKKKKRSNEGEGVYSSLFDSNKILNGKSDWGDPEIIPGTQDQETPMKIKKKKKISSEDKDLNSSFLDSKKAVHLVKTDWEDSQIIPDTQDQVTPMKTKKKTKIRSGGTELNSSFSDSKKVVHLVKTDWEDSQIIPDTQNQETSLKVKKKKRREQGDITQDEATESGCFSENVSDVLVNLASKKKKRKHNSLGNNEGTDYESEFEKSLRIKKESEEHEGISNFIETPSKSKKRSREDDIEETPLKVKKKKRRDKEGNELTDYESEFEKSLKI